MRRILYALLALVFCLAALASCGKGDVDETNKNVNGENTETDEGGKDHTAENESYVRIDAEGNPDADGAYILFGEYPQTLKAEDVDITETVDDRGYYLGADGAYYAKVIATPYEDGYAFGTGAEIVTERAYYFKVEPIRWRILSEEGNTARLLCDSIVANKAFDDDSNSYAGSDLRAWLNGEFYSTAFDSLEQAIIQTVTVDNSAPTTGDTASADWMENGNACEDTRDKIFLPSYEDVTNTDFGFSSSESDQNMARRWSVSDYALATGARMKRIDTFYLNGFCWLRSPYYALESHARIIDGYGVIYIGSNVSGVHIGVVPMMEISLK